MMRRSPPPRARTAVMYSRSRIASDCPRPTLANSTQPRTARMATRLSTPLPMVTAQTMAMRMYGKLSQASTKTPVKVAGAADRNIWDPGDLETIVGWGVTEEGGEAPDVLQEANVPITTDAYCANAYDSSFDPETMVCAGFPQGGVDTCQGDSGGPMFGTSNAGGLRVVGSTSWGEGCARPGKPGVYARVADAPLREWIRSQAPNGVD